MNVVSNCVNHCHPLQAINIGNFELLVCVQSMYVVNIIGEGRLKSLGPRPKQLHVYKCVILFQIYDNVVESLTGGCNRLKKKVLGDSPIIKKKVAWLYLHLWGFRGKMVERGEGVGHLQNKKRPINRGFCLSQTMA